METSHPVSEETRWVLGLLLDSNHGIRHGPPDPLLLSLFSGNGRRDPLQTRVRMRGTIKGRTFISKGQLAKEVLPGVEQGVPWHEQSESSVPIILPKR